VSSRSRSATDTSGATVVRIERGVDLDALRRADGRAHVAGDALRPAIDALREDVLAAIAHGVVGARLLG
jgi:hypothetical protein